MPAESLVDLVCVDLIARRRLGTRVVVEEYVRDFPALQSDSVLLDIIDAEICVAKELGEAIAAEDMIDRFPEFREDIVQLIGFDESSLRQGGGDMFQFATKPILPPSCADETDAKSQVLKSEESFDCTLAEFSLASSADAHAAKPAAMWKDDGEFGLELPVNLPGWFSAQQCVARSPGRWLVRGRDTVRGIPLALKIIEMPVQVTTEQSAAILDLCELASRVQNRRWVKPILAAVHGRYLAVIRPWIYANHWGAVSDLKSAASAGGTNRMPGVLASLAEIAFGLQTAHTTGATHGALRNRENLLVDHVGQLQIIDGACSPLAIERWQTNTGIRTLEERNGLIRTIYCANCRGCGSAGRGVLGRCRSSCRQIVATHSATGCGEIGQQLMQFASLDFQQARQSGGPRQWRRRLARWLASDT